MNIINCESIHKPKLDFNCSELPIKLLSLLFLSFDDIE